MRRPDRPARAAHPTSDGRSIVVVHILPPNRRSTTVRSATSAVAPRDEIPPTRIPPAPLPQALTKARTDAGLTRAALATALGMTEANIARMEDGRLRPSTLTLERVAEATGTRLRIGFERPAPTAH